MNEGEENDTIDKGLHSIQSTPLIDIICETERRHSPILSLKNNLESNDSPNTINTRKLFQSKLVNGVISDDRTFWLSKGNSGPDINLENHALIDNHEEDSDSEVPTAKTRHCSIGNRNHIKYQNSAMNTFSVHSKPKTDNFCYNWLDPSDDFHNPETIL